MRERQVLLEGSAGDPADQGFRCADKMICTNAGAGNKCIAVEAAFGLVCDTAHSITTSPMTCSSTHLQVDGFHGANPGADFHGLFLVRGP